MIIAKCDICGRTAAEYFQIKYRRITQQTTGITKQLDLCEKCLNKAVASFQQKKVSTACHNQLAAFDLK